MGAPRQFIKRQFGIKRHYGLECSIVLLFHMHRISGPINSIQPEKRACPSIVCFICNTFYIPLLLCYGCLDPTIQLLCQKNVEHTPKQFRKGIPIMSIRCPNRKPYYAPLTLNIIGETSLTLFRHGHVPTDIRNLVQNEGKQSND